MRRSVSPSRPQGGMFVGYACILIDQIFSRPRPVAPGVPRRGFVVFRDRGDEAGPLHSRLEAGLDVSTAN